MIEKFWDRLNYLYVLTDKVVKTSKLSSNTSILYEYYILYIYIRFLNPAHIIRRLFLALDRLLEAVMETEVALQFRSGVSGIARSLLLCWFSISHD